MREVNNFDKVMIGLLFFLVIGIFYLGFTLKNEGGTCAMNPCTYARSNNISCIENELLLRQNKISTGNEGVINFSGNYTIIDE